MSLCLIKLVKGIGSARSKKPIPSTHQINSFREKYLNLLLVLLRCFF